MSSGVSPLGSFEYIFHPRHCMYCRVPKATPNLAIPDGSHVRFNCAMSESVPVEMGNKQQDGVLRCRVGCVSGRGAEAHVASVAELVDITCRGD